MRIHIPVVIACAALLGGCAGSSEPAAPARDLDTVDLVDLPKNTAPPIREVEPCYPKDAVEKCASGKVKVAFIVDTEGKAQKLTVVEAEPDDTFVQAAARTVFEMEFQPLVGESGPVLSRKTMLIEFPRPRACGKRTE